MRTASRIRLVIGGAMCALLLAAAGPGASALAGQPGLPPGVHGPALYGQVVDVGSHAIVLQLASGAWTALNLTPQTVVVAPPGAAPGAGGIADNDWVLASYTSQPSASGAAFVARWLTYSTTAVTIGQTVHLGGTVTGILSGGGFTLQAENGSNWVVTPSPQAVVRIGNQLSTLALLQTGDRVQVWGTAAGQTVTASRIVYQVAGKHGRNKAQGKRGRRRGRDH